MQEHNKKYNELLQSKLDSEDALKEKAEKEKAKLREEMQEKCNRAVEEARRKEQIAAKQQMDQLRADYDADLNTLHGQIEVLKENIASLEKQLRQSELTIQSKDGEIIQQK